MCWPIVNATLNDLAATRPQGTCSQWLKLVHQESKDDYARTVGRQAPIEEELVLPASWVRVRFVGVLGYGWL